MLDSISIIVLAVLAISIFVLAFLKNINREKRNIAAALISFAMIGVAIAWFIIKVFIIK